MTRLVQILIALSLSDAALAAGSETPTQPTPITCDAGMIYDKETKSCVAINESRLSDDVLYEHARSLAFDGRFEEISLVLDSMKEGDTPRTLTLRGFAKRKMGDFGVAKAFYAEALEIDPNHWQARSYLGQGYVEAGDSAAARTQLRLIRTSGGRGTWAEVSLRDAIAKGAGYSY